MAIDQRGDDPPVGGTGDAARVMRLERIVTDAFVTVPVAFDVQSLRVETAAAVAMSEGIGIVILNGFIFHFALLLSGVVFAQGRATLSRVTGA